MGKVLGHQTVYHRITIRKATGKDSAYIRYAYKNIALEPEA